jgi:hypothetical protein
VSNITEGLKTESVAAVGKIAVAVVILNVLVGSVHVWDCRRSGGEFDKCWDRALEISGLGDGGRLAVALGVSGFAWGYNTLNPNLKRPRDE